MAALWIQEHIWRDYKDMPRAFGGIISYIGTVKKDKGFYFLSAVIKCIVGNRSVVYLFIIAALQAGMLFLCIS